MNRCFHSLFGVLLLLFAMAAQGMEFGDDLRDLKGNSFDLSNVVGKGKWVLVMIWASDCHVCAKETPKISAFHSEYKDKDATVIGLAIDGYEKKADVERFINQYKPSFPNYIGEMPAVAHGYGSIASRYFRGTPTFVLYSPQGEVLGVNPGPVRTSSLEKFMAKNSKPEAMPMASDPN